MWLTEKVIERFWAKVDKNGPISTAHPELGPCWVWLNATTRGYGAFTKHTKRVSAHRVAYELQVGPIPEGMHVLHHCDNPLCVRGDHLWLGSNLDNTADRVEKGRSSTGQKHAASIDTLHGEQHPRAKLTEAMVRDARARYIPRKVSYASLAKEYGVHLNAVHYAVKCKTWAHVR